MTSIFDGMTGILNDTFGGPVMHTPNGAPAVEIKAVFRRAPIQILQDDESEVLVMAPTLTVPEPVASAIAVDELIQPAGGSIYRVLKSHKSGSPALDAAVVFQLREVSPNGG